MVTALGVMDFAKLVEATLKVEKVELMNRVEGIDSRREVWVRTVHPLHPVRSLEVLLLRVLVKHQVRASPRGLDLSSHRGEASPDHQWVALQGQCIGD